MRYRDQEVAPRIFDLGFNIAFLIAGIRVHEFISESVMRTEPDELIGQFTAAVLEDLRDHGRGIVEPYLRGYTAYVLEDLDHGFHEAFSVLTIHQLWETCVAVWE